MDVEIRNEQIRRVYLGDEATIAGVAVVVKAFFNAGVPKDARVVINGGLVSAYWDEKPGEVTVDI